MSISQNLALCVGRELGAVTLILESDCTFIFTVLLLLMEGLEVFVALSFDIAVAPLFVVLVVTRYRVER